MTAARWWGVALTGNGAALGWSLASSDFAGATVAVVAAVFLTVCMATDLGAERDTARTELGEVRDLLHELLEEHGPLWCDPACACTACVAGAYLTHHGYEVPTDAR